MKEGQGTIQPDTCYTDGSRVGQLLQCNSIAVQPLTNTLQWDTETRQSSQRVELQAVWMVIILEAADDTLYNDR